MRRKFYFLIPFLLIPSVSFAMRVSGGGGSGGGGSSSATITSILGGTGITVTNGTGPVVTISATGGGSSSVTSAFGGLLTSSGSITQTGISTTPVKLAIFTSTKDFSNTVPSTSSSQITVSTAGAYFLGLNIVSTGTGVYNFYYQIRVNGVSTGFTGQDTPSVRGPAFGVMNLSSGDVVTAFGNTNTTAQSTITVQDAQLAVFTIGGSGGGGGSSSSSSGSPPAYGAIYLSSGAFFQVVSTTPAKASLFNLNGLSNMTTPDNSNDQITLSTAGVYRIHVRVEAATTTFTGSLNVASFYGEIRVNGSTTGFICERQPSTGNSRLAICDMEGLYSASVNDVVSFYVSAASAPAGTGFLASNAELVVEGEMGGGGGSGGGGAGTITAVNSGIGLSGGGSSGSVTLALRNDSTNYIQNNRTGSPQDASIDVYSPGSQEFFVDSVGGVIYLNDTTGTGNTNLVYEHAGTSIANTGTNGLLGNYFIVVSTRSGGNGLTRVQINSLDERNFFTGKTIIQPQIGNPFVTFDPSVRQSSFTSQIVISSSVMDGAGSVGTNTQVFTSRGIGLAPTWQAASGGSGGPTIPSTFTWTLPFGVFLSTLNFSLPQLASQEISAGSFVCQYTSGCIQATQFETTPNNVNYVTITFQAGTTQYAQGHFELPDNFTGSTVTIKMTTISTATATVSWKVDARCVPSGTGLDGSFGTAVSISTNSLSNVLTDSQESAAITPSGTCTGGLSHLWVRLYRNGDPQTDAQLTGAMIYYAKNKYAAH